MKRLHQHHPRLLSDFYKLLVDDSTLGHAAMDLLIKPDLFPEETIQET